MKYTRLGRTGLKVSRICLGCMTFGVPERGAHAWTLPEPETREIIRHAIEQDAGFAGISRIAGSDMGCGKVADAGDDGPRRR